MKKFLIKKNKSSRFFLIKSLLGNLLLPSTCISRLPTILVYLLISLLLLFFLNKNHWAETLKSKSNDFLVLGYYPVYFQTKYPFEKINFSGLTHIALAFADLDQNGFLVTSNDYLNPDWVELAHKKNVKVLLSIGGWGKGFNFSAVSAHPIKRGLFAHAAVLYCLNHNLDGLDIDWEFPKNEEDEKNFCLLAKEIREVIQRASRPLLLFTALGASENFLKYYNLPELHKYFDYISIMTYDYHGPWTALSGHNAPLFGNANNFPNKKMPLSSTVFPASKNILEKVLQINGKNKIPVSYMLKTSAPERKKTGILAELKEVFFINKKISNIILEKIEESVDFYNLSKDRSYQGKLAGKKGMGKGNQQAAGPSSENGDLKNGARDAQWFAEHNNIQASINKFKEKGLITSRTLLGIPFYGRSFSSPALFQKYKKTHYLTYRKIMDLAAGTDYSEKFDAKARVPYLAARQRAEIISYDNPKSIREKVAYFKKIGFRGVIIWELTQDQLPDGSAPLLYTIEEIIKGKPRVSGTKEKVER
jgi:GH18 family chitinase